LPASNRLVRGTAHEEQAYDEIGEDLPEGARHPRPGGLADQRDDIEASGLFQPVLVRHFEREVIYDADGYIRLLDASSGHIAMEPWKRRRLYSRSGADCMSDQTDCSAVAGTRYSTSVVDATSRRRRGPILNWHENACRTR
jgi:hypothetical protein